jgi:alkanesulfonate monooxygenase SsuD/methylene tetrahydromethanopterin reductase-like flavin-dependent oxidoreductase (luciferase family)
MTHGAPEFGLMDQGWAAPEMSDADSLAETLATINLADELGYDSAWVGEHHHRRPEAAFWGRVPATEILLGHAIATTKSIALGTGVRILSTTPALRTAEEMSMLSVLSGGRVDFGVGLGSGQHGLKSREEKAAAFRDALAELLAILRNDPATGLPELSPVSPVDITTRIWAAARDETTLGFLAELGVNLVVGQAEIGAMQAKHVERYRHLGGKGRTRGVRLVHVAATEAEALERTTAAADLYYALMSKGGYHKEAVDKGLISAVPRDRHDMLDQISFIVGTPETVVEKLDAYIAETGIDQLDAMVRIPRLAISDVHDCMRLLKTEVIPNLTFGLAPKWARTA